MCNRSQSQWSSTWWCIHSNFGFVYLYLCVCISVFVFVYLYPLNMIVALESGDARERWSMQIRLLMFTWWHSISALMSFFVGQKSFEEVRLCSVPLLYDICNIWQRIQGRLRWMQKSFKHFGGSSSTFCTLSVIHRVRSSYKHKHR